MALFGLLLLSCLLALHARAVERGGPDRSTKKTGLKALRVWADSLTPDDYNATLWQTLWKQPGNFFEHYITKLSDIYMAEGANINFILVGACDGTNDRTIRDRFLPYSHWRGAFVEPFQINYQDLVDFMNKNGAGNRTHLIHGAATDKC
jgi:hypothetical protein